MPGSKDKYCKTDYNPTTECSKPYNEMKHSFYSYCPNVNGNKCGLDTQNLTIEASKEV